MVLACSDIHGNLKLFNKLKEYLTLEDKIFFLGDATDRGSEGYEIMKAIAKDVRFTYLKGNHEDMLYKAGVNYFQNDYTGKDYHLLVQNGGYDTFNDLIADPAGQQWCNYIRRLPTHAEYTNANGITFFISHAGFNPEVDEEDNIVFPSDYDLIWDREHYYNYFDYEGRFTNHIVVHGHTPCPYLAEDLGQSHWTKTPGPLWYDNRSKVCLDAMSFKTNMLYLLNLDTLTHKIITI